MCVCARTHTQPEVDFSYLRVLLFVSLNLELAKLAFQQAVGDLSASVLFPAVVGIPDVCHLAVSVGIHTQALMPVQQTFYPLKPLSSLACVLIYICIASPCCLL